MTKCNEKQFNYDFFKEKINKVNKKVGVANFNNSYIIAAKLAIEISKKINDFNEKSMAKDGLVGQSWIILVMIFSSEDEICAIDLCDYMNQNKATVSRIVESLKDKNFIQEIENKTDRRKYNLIITELGSQYVKEKMINHTNYYNTVFSGVNTDILIPEMLNVLNGMSNKGNKYE